MHQSALQVVDSTQDTQANQRQVNLTDIVHTQFRTHWSAMAC